jgi:hypothetical protein
MTLIALAAGVLIGWNLPQPEFAKTAQAVVIAWIKAKVNG